MESESRRYDLSAQNVNKATEQLEDALGKESVVVDPSACTAFSGNSWDSPKETEVPSIVIKPASTQNVRDALKVCSNLGIPVYPRGGGTGFYGSTITTYGGMCIDLSNMDQILEMHEDDMQASVQAGVEWQDLNRRLADRGLYFPPDPGPGARIGGMIAMNCSGTNAYRYGPMKDWVVSMTVVLADGSILKTRNRPHKSSAGFDLTKLMVGSEGTLGIVTEAVIKLTTMPKNSQVGIAIFSDNNSAVRACIKMMRAGQYDAVEFIDQYSMRAVNHSDISSIHWDEKPSVFLKFSGNSGTVDDLATAMRDIAREHNCCEVKVASAADEEGKEWWHVRKMIVHALFGMKKTPTDLFLTCDAAVPRSGLVEAIEATHRVAQDAGFFCSTTGHIGDGNVHTGVVVPADQAEAGQRIIDSVRETALRLDGTISGEHGIGTELKQELFDESGAVGIETMRKIKFALDPKGILSPGHVLDIVG